VQVLRANGVDVTEVRSAGAAVEAAAELGPLLDTFFENVLVLADDSAVRANRLRLLLNVRDTLGRLGELSQIPRLESL